MIRLGLLSTMAALALTGCVTTYGYRNDQGGDYYYAEPSVEYNVLYGTPYGTIGYGGPGGWYGSFGYTFGSRYPYGRYGYPYGYWDVPFGWYPYSYYPGPIFHHRPHGHGPYPPPGPGHRPPPPGGGRPGPDIVDRERHDNDGGPWRHLDRRVRSPGPIGNPPGGVIRTPRVAEGAQPMRTPRVVQPPPGQPQSSPPPPPREAPRATPRFESPPTPRATPREREFRRESTP